MLKLNIKPRKHCAMSAQCFLYKKTASMKFDAVLYYASCSAIGASGIGVPFAIRVALM